MASASSREGATTVTARGAWRRASRISVTTVSRPASRKPRGRTTRVWLIHRSHHASGVRTSRGSRPSCSEIQWCTLGARSSQVTRSSASYARTSAHACSLRRALRQSSRSRQKRLVTATNVVVLGSRPRGSSVRLRMSDWALSARVLARAQLPARGPERDVGVGDLGPDDPVPAGQERALACAHGDLADGRGGEDEPADQDRERGLGREGAGPLIEVDGGDQLGIAHRTILPSATDTLGRAAAFWWQLRHLFCECGGKRFITTAEPAWFQEFQGELSCHVPVRVRKPVY